MKVLDVLQLVGKRSRFLSRMMRRSVSGVGLTRGEARLMEMVIATMMEREAAAWVERRRWLAVWYAMERGDSGGVAGRCPGHHQVRALTYEGRPGGSQPPHRGGLTAGRESPPSPAPVLSFAAQPRQAGCRG